MPLGSPLTGAIIPLSFLGKSIYYDPLHHFFLLTSTICRLFLSHLSCLVPSAPCWSLLFSSVRFFPFWFVHFFLKRYICFVFVLGHVNEVKGRRVFFSYVDSPLLLAIVAVLFTFALPSSTRGAPPGGRWGPHLSDQVRQRRASAFGF